MGENNLSLADIDGLEVFVNKACEYAGFAASAHRSQEFRQRRLFQGPPDAEILVHPGLQRWFSNANGVLCLIFNGEHRLISLAHKFVL